MKLNLENFETHSLTFGDRQAGISLIFDPDDQRYSYNAYCLEKKLIKELFTCEYEFLEDALTAINSEFGNWELKSLIKEKKGCSTCVAKK